MADDVSVLCNSVRTGDFLFVLFLFTVIISCLVNFAYRFHEFLFILVSGIILLSDDRFGRR